MALYNQRDDLSAAIDTWTHLAERIDKRLPVWNTLKRLLAQASGLSGADVLVAQATTSSSSDSCWKNPTR